MKSGPKQPKNYGARFRLSPKARVEVAAHVTAKTGASSPIPPLQNKSTHISGLVGEPSDRDFLSQSCAIYGNAMRWRLLLSFSFHSLTAAIYISTFFLRYAAPFRSLSTSKMALRLVFLARFWAVTFQQSHDGFQITFCR